MKLSLSFKIAFAIMVVIVVEVMVALKFERDTMKNSLLETISEEFMQTINMVENEFSFIEQSNLYLAKIFTKQIKDMKEVKNMDLQKSCSSMHVDNLIVLDKNANIISQAGLFRVSGNNLKSFHIVHQVLKKKRALSAIERVGDIFVFYTSVPIVINKKFLGLVLIGLQISNKVLQEMHKGSNIEVAIVGDRAIGASSFRDNNHKTLTELPVDYIKYLMLLDKKIEFLTAIINSKEYFIKAKKLRFVDPDTTNASLMILYDTNNYKLQLKKISKILYILVVAMIFSMLITVFIISLYIKKSFKKLIDGLKSITKGEYGKQININTKDELQVVAQYFNKMSIASKERIDDILQLKENEKILYQKATTDKLTGLYNREKFESMFSFMLKTAKRDDTKVAFCIMDIDHFKNINDTFGHLVGDLVLKELAKILKNSLREIDIVGRWGGEEFVMAMYVQSLDDAKEIVEKLRKFIKNYNFPKIGSLTCSFGVIIGKNDEDNFKIFNMADKLLYKAKVNGRDRVEI